MDFIREVLLFWMVLQLSRVSSQYTNGDARLSHGNGTIGVLEVFLNDRWGTVCSSGFNIGSAAAVCRQLGFLKGISFGSPNNYSLQSPHLLTPVLTNVECPTYSNTDYATSGSLHILRCPHSVAHNNSCAVNDIIAVSCDPILIIANPYNGQVQLVGNKVQSSGLLEIYLHSRWGTVCDQDFSVAAADSVCRQLGYTNAVNYSATQRSVAIPVWIDTINCFSSQSCFSTGCIIHNPTAVTSGSCATHIRDVIVNCTYTSTEGGTLLSGNEYICRITGFNVLIIILPTVFGFIFLILLCVLMACLICCFTVSTCPLYAHKTKRKYEGLI